MHRAILSQSSELEAKPAQKLWGEKTNDVFLLPELDETTAHTLVHYLYTGRYQTLESYTSPAEQGAIAQFKLSTCVYCAAMRYKLPGLAELAKEKITSFGEDLTILDILGTARDFVFPYLPDDEAWFAAYLEDAIKAAVGEDPNLFLKEGFSDQIEGDRRYRHVVTKAMFSALSRGTLAPRQDPKPSAEAPAVEPVQEVPVQEPKPETPAMDEAPSSHEEPPVESSEQSNQAEHAQSAGGAVQLDDIESSQDGFYTAEAFTDELDSYRSKTFRKLRNKTVEEKKPLVADEPSAPSPPRPDSEETVEVTVKPTHARHDSAVLIEKPAPVVPVAEEEKVAKSPSVASEPVIVDGSNGTMTKAAKKRERKKKKAAAAAAGADGAVV